MPSPHPYLERLQTFQASIPVGETWLLATPTDIQYLTGFMSLVPEEREGFLLLSTERAWLLQASFSPRPASADKLEIKMNVSPSALIGHLKDWIRTQPWKILKIDMTQLTAIEYQYLLNEQWQPQEIDKKILWQQRLRKDKTELALMKKAGQIADACFTKLQQHLTAGITEQALSRQLEILLLQAGSSKPAFPTIVAFGEHGALPHHQPTDRPLTPETPVLIDFGATVEGYRSDMTRSWWFGNQPSETFTKVASLVKQAYDLALAEVSNAKSLGRIDQAARDFLSKNGYGQHFIHTTGHGVGLDIHEPPSVYYPNTQPIQTGFVITIEPGVYISDAFGFRYENTLAITEHGPEELTRESGVQ